jgi:type III restriction enzyme
MQGWKKDKIYPDFLIQKTDNSFIFIETKGNQLKGNDDTIYKNKVLESLSKANFIKIGNFELMGEHANISFNLIHQEDWEASIREII